MTSQNLELFPDDLFARKGRAAPAGDRRKDKAEVVALEATETEAAPGPDDAKADAIRGEAPGPSLGPLAEGRNGEVEESAAAAEEPGDGKKRTKSKAKTGAKTEAAPAASILKFRLLDEVSESFDEILRCAQGQAAAPAETAETAEAAADPAAPAETPEIETPDSESSQDWEPITLPAQAQVKERTGQVATLWRPASWTPRARVSAALLLLAGGILAGWYAAMPGSSPDLAEPVVSGSDDRAKAAGEPTAPVEGSDQAPAESRRVLGGAEGKEAVMTEDQPPSGTGPGVPAPRVDVVRVEEDGSAVIAGLAAPGAELIVLHNGAPIGVARADAFGQWVLLPEEPLGGGPHEFGLVVKTVEGTVTLPGPAGSESEAPAAGDPGGGAGDRPPRDQEGRLRKPEAGSKSAQAPVAIPLPPQKPAAGTAVSPGEDMPPYVVQLASADSAEGAASEWRKLRKAHPELLAKRDLTVQEADLEGRGAVFRVRTGSFETLVAARRFCAAFRRQRQECLVVKLRDADEGAPPRTRISRHQS
ncbi:MAG: SPOR domain-containing protein [Kiloniellales bacterium]|nr:SPOR domain-containing protein [Kiloniellales bacterium]